MFSDFSETTTSHIFVSETGASIMLIVLPYLRPIVHPEHVCPLAFRDSICQNKVTSSEVYLIQVIQYALNRALKLQNVSLLFGFGFPSTHFAFSDWKSLSFIRVNIPNAVGIVLLSLILTPRNIQCPGIIVVASSLSNAVCMCLNFLT